MDLGGEVLAAGADGAGADFGGVRAGGEAADAFAAFAEEEVVEFGFVLGHEVEGGLAGDDAFEVGVEGDVEEGGDASDGGGEVLAHVFVGEEEDVGVVAVGPPGEEVGPVASGGAVLGAVLEEAVAGEVGDGDGAGFDEPALHEAEGGDEGVAGVAEGDDVAAAPWDAVPAEVGFEGAGLGDLVGVEVEAEVGGDFDEGDDAGDVVEVDVAAGAEAVDDLLDPGGAAFGEGGDDDVGGSELEGEAGGEALGGAEEPLELVKLFEGGGSAPSGLSDASRLVAGISWQVRAP